MKAHKLTVLVLDFEEQDIEAIIESIENNKHYSISVEQTASTEIGEWSDDHELNKPHRDWKKYFDDPALVPYKCPVCDGTTKVSRPPWIAGDVQEWVASETSYECGACEKGIIWR